MSMMLADVGRCWPRWEYGNRKRRADVAKCLTEARAEFSAFQRAEQVSCDEISDSVVKLSFFLHFLTLLAPV